MTTFLYTTDSNNAKVTDADAVNTLVDSTDYWFTVEPDVTGNSGGGGTIAFSTVDDPNGAFDIHPEPESCTSVVDEFLAELTEYLTETLTVKCIETQGYGDPAVWKWVAEPDGSVTLHQF